jgi:hypothetical protein
MATEKELGYEPSLLIEMVVERDQNRAINTAIVQKDRADRLNGHEIQMPNYAKLRAHFEALNIGGEHYESMERRDSKEMFPDADESGWDKEKQDRAIYAEEIAELLKKHFPSQSVEDKQKRADLLEKFFGTRSWTAVENTRSSALEQAYARLRDHLEPKEEAA